MAADPSQREVSVYDSIILCDMDEDGVAERRRVLSIGDSGQHILENEVTDFHPVRRHLAHYDAAPACRTVHL